MGVQQNNISANQNSIFKLKRLYLQSVPAGSIAFDGLVPVGKVDWGFQDHLFNTILSKDATAYRPADAYTRRFLKFLISCLESNLAEDEELHDSILTLYSNLMSKPDSPSDATKPTFITYLLPPNQSLSQEDGEKDGEVQVVISERKSVLSADGHTGSRTWEAALALGEFFLFTPSPISKPIPQCRILELGAGTAFTSILLSKLGAKHVLATDGDERVCEAIRRNIDHNYCRNVVSASQLLWGASQEDSTVYTEPWDLVIGGDITYDTRDLSDLALTLKKLLVANQDIGAKAIISATVRNEDTLREFDTELSSAGLNFKVQEIGESGRQLWYYGSDTPIRIYTIHCG
ncbi:hypothetical protein TWF569_007476 [Orbilia oligospora]|uniref:Uncharacterized protein n=2 Tax=Orbilia oligospora TaxID=2813651 RepID=A0A7C8J913_ORBOL|nr:hypothetical protein TWF706_008918 [Orbilia oligospora]KAF3096006.1 hypothetical protein TWF103_009921 [Orbilia oligospora]KAF3097362.1 hypothetical protein TWF102_006342 [Orbilia oligospora]KAF3132004.1 hypothetical protein TWF594_009706 [Orbilia oligospora]KAF3143081.1 hypothetical protein TWF569_007476 [Orbilia oligospora]